MLKPVRVAPVPRQLLLLQQHHAGLMRAPVAHVLGALYLLALPELMLDRCC